MNTAQSREAAMANICTTVASTLVILLLGLNILLMIKRIYLENKRSHSNLLSKEFEVWASEKIALRKFSGKGKMK